jgi:ABC-type uncharacterized transport system permease subunit
MVSQPRYNWSAQDMPLFTRQTVEVSGVVCFFQFVVSSLDDEEDLLYRYAREMRQQIRDIIQKQVAETLGPEFQVLEVEMRPGSAVIAFALGTAFAIYMGFSRYESFIKSMGLLTSQISALFGHFFRTGPGQAPFSGRVSVNGVWRPGPAMTSANQIVSLSSGIDSGLLLLAYLVLSHAAMMGILLWLVVRHLK